MIVMTDGLHALMGNVMRRTLTRFTRTPFSGACTGALSTAVLQSSSATTVAAVGFVGAGLLTFPQALGIIFGANIGTTVTGWIVALFGFKLKLTSLTLPIVFLGVLLKLFGKGHVASTGYTLAGFGLIFVGISTMQQSMQGMENFFIPDDFAADTLSGRLKLVLLGILATLVTQSSSAGVAATITALFMGAINFQQATALVIGMDVGTTVTAVMATLGGSVATLRTGLSHVIYNILTAIGALLLITPYTILLNNLSDTIIQNHAELALVGFHSLFNIIGVIIVLPFTRYFAALMYKIVPEKRLRYTQNLDKRYLSEPAVALVASGTTIIIQLRALLQHSLSLLDNTNQYAKTINLKELQSALDTTHTYIERIHISDTVNDQEVTNRKQLLAYIHCLDHLQRLHERCDEEADRAKTAAGAEDLAAYRERLSNCISTIIPYIDQHEWGEAHGRLDEVAGWLSDSAQELRAQIMEHVAAGGISVPQATQQLEAIRWLRRVSTHISRILYHLKQSMPAITPQTK